MQLNNDNSILHHRRQEEICACNSQQNCSGRGKLVHAIQNVQRTGAVCIVRLFMHDQTLCNATEEQCPVVGMGLMHVPSALTNGWRMKPSLDLRSLDDEPTPSISSSSSAHLLSREVFTAASRRVGSQPCHSRARTSHRLSLC